MRKRTTHSSKILDFNLNTVSEFMVIFLRKEWLCCICKDKKVYLYLDKEKFKNQKACSLFQILSTDFFLSCLLYSLNKEENNQIVNYYFKKLKIVFKLLITILYCKVYVC
jgi:hypothetical protein